MSDIFYTLNYIKPGNTPWNKDNILTKAKAVRPATNPPRVHPLIVSSTDILKNLLIAQNPESLGNDNPIPPAHIAIAQSTGDTELVAIVPVSIDAVVINATVVEPCAQRIT